MKVAGPQKGSSSVLVTVAAVLITALITGGGVYYWQQLKGKEAKTELPSTTASPAPALPSSPGASPDSPTAIPDPYAGWSTYTNDIYNYQFRYLPGAVITEVEESAFSLSPEEVDAGMTFEEKFREYTGKVCLTINHGLGYIQISAPPNGNFAHVICGRTGRAYEGPSRTESLTIDGDVYTASGFEEQGPGETLNLHNETLVVILAGGTRIEYGSRPDETATFVDYQAMRDEIIQMVESYQEL